MRSDWPDWPAMMLRKTAAAYCDLSEAAFEQEVNAGRLPAPIFFGGKPHWYRASVDKHLERIAGLMSDWRNDSPLYAERTK